jgi:hypothetical protein
MRFFLFFVIFGFFIRYIESTVNALSISVYVRIALSLNDFFILKNVKNVSSNFFFINKTQHSKFEPQVIINVLDF